MSEAFDTKVSSIREELAQSVSDGTSFREAAEAAGFTVQTTGLFSVYGGLPEDAGYGDVIPATIMGLQSGEVSDAVPVDSGYLVACVLSREPGEFGAAAMIRPQLASSLSRYRSGVTYRQWAQSLLANGQFTDLMAPVAIPDEEDEAESSEDEASGGDQTDVM
jgi:hypothetical protein